MTFARQIVDPGGDDVLAVKDHQPILRAAARTFFEFHLDNNLENQQYRRHEATDDGHGRVDERSYDLAKIPADFALRKKWPKLKVIGYSLRVTRTLDGRDVDEVRYDSLSRSLSGQRFSEAVRGDWSIESLHGVLDVTFREDDGRTRERTPVDALSRLRRFAVTLPNRHSQKEGIRSKMIRCLMITDFLTEVMSLQ